MPRVADSSAIPTLAKTESSESSRTYAELIPAEYSTFRISNCPNLQCCDRIPQIAHTKGKLMTFAALILILATFLLSVIIGALALTVAGIRGDDRARNLTGAPRTRAAALARRLLGVDMRGPEAGSESRDEHS
jgi:hypothetical protein